MCRANCPRGVRSGMRPAPAGVRPPIRFRVREPGSNVVIQSSELRSSTNASRCLPPVKQTLQQHNLSSTCRQAESIDLTQNISISLIRPHPLSLRLRKTDLTLPLRPTGPFTCMKTSINCRSIGTRNVLGTISGLASVHKSTGATSSIRPPYGLIETTLWTPVLANSFDQDRHRLWRLCSQVMLIQCAHCYPSSLRRCMAITRKGRRRKYQRYPGVR